MLRGLLEQSLNRLWYRPANFLAYLLWPFSCVFSCVAFLRRIYLQRTAFHPGVPVIVVGNITVGGTGKTPMVIGLVKALCEQGFKPGIITRGYGVSIKRSFVMAVGDTAERAGDEAREMFEASGVPLAVGPDRCASARLLCEQGCDVIVSDDGLQHYRLARDVELVMIDPSRGLGNGFCLPAGPLRESADRLKQADAVLSLGDKYPGAHTLDLVPEGLRRVDGEPETLSFEQARAHCWQVCTAIANPSKFLKTLDGLSIHYNLVKTLPDHAKFSPADIDLAPGEYGIMTRKDAVKCRPFASQRHWYLEVSAKLDTFVMNVLLSKLSKKGG